MAQCATLLSKYSASQRLVFGSMPCCVVKSMLRCCDEGHTEWYPLVIRLVSLKEFLVKQDANIVGYTDS